LATYPVLQAGLVARAAAPLAAVGLVFVLISLWRHGRLAGAALFLLAAEYLVVLLTDRVSPSTVIGYAAGLLLLAELLFMAAGLPSSGFVEGAVVAARLVRLLALGSGATLAAVLVLALGRQLSLTPVRATLLGVLATALACALPWLLVTRGRGYRGGERRPPGPPAGRPPDEEAAKVDAPR